MDQIWGPKHVIAEHNIYLDDYFESLDPKEECSLVKGLEDLSCDRNDEHDYIDDDFISWNGTVYALKVNSYNRFLSFMNLRKKDSIVYKNWDVFSRKFVVMLKWFYLVYLNYDSLDEIPPRIRVIKLDLLALHKTVDSLGGYVAVTLSGKWSTVAQLQALTTKEGDAIKECFKKFIDLVLVYHDIALVPWIEKAQKEIGESSWTAEQKNPQGFDDSTGRSVRDGYAEQEMNRLGVRDGSNGDQKDGGTSSGGSSDFEVIV